MAMMRIVLSAGEASGDAYGAALIREIRKATDLPVSFRAIGGTQIRAEGAEIIADSSHWGAIGAIEAVKLARDVLVGRKRLEEELNTGTPGLFMPIDFGFVNVRMCRVAKARGWKVLYFIPPGSWRRDRQGADLPTITDAIVTPFPWSAEMLNQNGGNAHFFGHPLKQLIQGEMEKLTDASRVPDSIALLPGSRNHELKFHLPILAKALPLIEARRGRPVKATLGLAPGASVAAILKRWIQLSGRKSDKYEVGRSTQVLATAEAALVCSGTATLQAALCNTPHVIFYRATRLLEVQRAITRTPWPKFIGLPNIILDRGAVPEFVQMAATPEAIANEFLRVQKDPSGQLAAFAELSELLGEPTAISRAARLAVEMSAIP